MVIICYDSSCCFNIALVMALGNANWHWRRPMVSFTYNLPVNSIRGSSFMQNIIFPTLQYLLVCVLLQKSILPCYSSLPSLANKSTLHYCALTSCVSDSNKSIWTNCCSNKCWITAEGCLEVLISLAKSICIDFHMLSDLHHTYWESDLKCATNVVIGCCNGQKV